MFWMSYEWEMLKMLESGLFPVCFFISGDSACTSIAFFPRTSSWSTLKSGTFPRVSNVLTKAPFDMWSNSSGVQQTLLSSSSSMSWAVGTARCSVLPSLSAERHRKRQRHGCVVANCIHSNLPQKSLPHLPSSYVQLLPSRWQPRERFSSPELSI